MNVLSTGEKIRKRRKELGMTLKDLAGNRITTGQISLVESGKSNPSMDLLEYIAKSLGTSVEYLLESEEKQAIKICRYYENMAFCHLFRYDLENVEYFLLKMGLIVDNYNLEQMKYKIYFIKGIHSYYLKNYDEAVQSMLTANLGFVKFSMNEDVIQVFLYLTYISVERKNYMGAIVHLSCIIKIIENELFNDDYVSFKVYYLTWESYLNIGKIELGDFYLNKAMEVLDKIYKPSDSGILFMEKSFEFMKDEDIDNAVMFSDMARRSFEELVSLEDRKDIEIELSKYLVKKDDLDEGEKYLRRAKLLIENYRFDDKIEMYITFIKLYLKRRNLEKAREYLNRFGKIVNMKNISEVEELYVLKYDLAVLEEDYKQAEDAINFLCDFCLEFGEHKKAGKFYLKLYKFYIDIEKFKDAEEAIVKARVQYEKGGCKIVF